MTHEHFAITEEELELLKRIEPEITNDGDPARYNYFPKEVLADLCRIKDRGNDLFMRRAQAAKEVIDLISKAIGINPDDTSFWLYAPDADGSSPILRRIEEYISRSGDKGQLKRRVQELEKENSILRSLIQK